MLNCFSFFSAEKKCLRRKLDEIQCRVSPVDEMRRFFLFLFNYKRQHLQRDECIRDITLKGSLL